MTTIKTLKDGRTLTTDGTRLFVDDSDIGAAQAHAMAPQGAVVAFAKTSAGNIGLTRSDIEIINRTASPVVGIDPEFAARREQVARQYREWNQSHNDGGNGYNPFAAEYHNLFDLGLGREPAHKSDL